MSTQLTEDLKRHSTLAFQRVRPGADLIRRYHEFPEAIRNHSKVKQVYEWLLIPYSLWPIDVIGLAQHLFQSTDPSRHLKPDLARLLDLLGSPPPLKTCTAISAHKHNVKDGNYDSVINAQHKFDFKEDLLSENPDFSADWDWIKKAFNVRKIQSSNAVIRRRMVSERNFRQSEWDFKWRKREEKFWNVFDAFCHKWVLYGMQHDKPFLQNPTVNVTPYGTMIFIPRYWSIDSHRDLKWRAITRLHKSRGVSKQGLKLALNHKERLRESARARQLYAEATAKGFRGERRSDWVITKLGLHPETNPKQLWRLLRAKS